MSPIFVVPIPHSIYGTMAFTHNVLPGHMTPKALVGFSAIRLADKSDKASWDVMGFMSWDVMGFQRT